MGDRRCLRMIGGLGRPLPALRRENSHGSARLSSRHWPSLISLRTSEPGAENRLPLKNEGALRRQRGAFL